MLWETNFITRAIDTCTEPVHDWEGAILELSITAQVVNSSFKVETSAFASDNAVRQMMKDMEELYATSFGVSFLFASNTQLMIRFPLYSSR